MPPPKRPPDMEPRLRQCAPDPDKILRLGPPVRSSSFSALRNWVAWQWWALVRRAKTRGVTEVALECMRVLQEIWLPESLQPQTRQRRFETSLPSPSKAELAMIQRFQNTTYRPQESRESETYRQDPGAAEIPDAGMEMPLGGLADDSL